MTSLPPPYLPVPVTDVELAFPARVSHLMPDMEEIPKGLGPWTTFFARVFTKGFGGVSFVLHDGIDGDMAYRHLAALLGSYEPKHEHKQAAFSHLCSVWFKGAVFDDGNGKTIYYPEGFSL